MKPLRIICQYLIGLILLATGLGKLLDVPGFVGVIESYQVLPSWSHYPVAAFMVLLELRLAEALITGRGKLLAGYVSIAMHCAFTGWAVLALVRGLDIPNCGCFGVFMARPLTTSTVFEDLALVIISIILVWALRKEERQTS